MKRLRWFILLQVMILCFTVFPGALALEPDAAQTWIRAQDYEMCFTAELPEGTLISKIPPEDGEGLAFSALTGNEATAVFLLLLNSTDGDMVRITDAGLLEPTPVAIKYCELPSGLTDEGLAKLNQLLVQANDVLETLTLQYRAAETAVQVDTPLLMIETERFILEYAGEWSEYIRAQIKADESVQILVQLSETEASVCTVKVDSYDGDMVVELADQAGNRIPVAIRIDSLPEGITSEDEEIFFAVQRIIYDIPALMTLK